MMKESGSRQLTIIIPHYNYANGLRRLLGGIPAREEIQTIVIDDNSTRQTGELQEVIDEYRGQVEFYVNDRGVQGPGTCRNIALEHAEGKWLLFADDDDYFLDGFYETVKRYFDTDYDLVFFGYTSRIVGENGELGGWESVIRLAANTLIIISNAQTEEICWSLQARQACRHGRS